ncbi:hypothetical protein J7I97_21415 [Streptomyces sp. ISL-87]|uniref:hypothetical protein n=1 Tax=unclassified Streptomyces TaxID=2593676 RepID=UPI001BE6DA70|nr:MULTISPECIES: hypothetical protein [unclassified Streptomyces]MBT2405029.1 hypothetical protein [Streptomyces sp. ISL-21]MBT2456999.1 hypothetical protein [Streptomyces sp. ISL-86]MBT2610755.1 hypothetical protein [Streptomyces sp. ISL-87]
MGFLGAVVRAVVVLGADFFVAGLPGAESVALGVFAAAFFAAVFQPVPQLTHDAWALVLFVSHLEQRQSAAGRLGVGFGGTRRVP